MRYLLLPVLLVVGTAHGADADAKRARSERGHDVQLYLYLRPGIVAVPKSHSAETYSLVVEIRNGGAEPIEFQLPAGIEKRSDREPPSDRIDRSKRLAAAGWSLRLVYDLPPGRDKPLAFHSGPRPVTRLAAPVGGSVLAKVEVPLVFFTAGECGIRAVLDFDGRQVAASERATVLCVTEPPTPK